MSACQWSAGAEEWWAGWAGSAGIIPPSGGEEGFRGGSAGTRGAARLAVRSARSGGAGCLEEAAAYFAKGGGAEAAPGVGGHWSPGARLPGLCWCAGGAGVPGGRATASRRAGCRRLPPDDADWSFSSGLSSVPRTEPCGYRRVTAALRPRGRGRRAARRCAPARAFPGPARPRPRREGPGATARAAGPGVSRPGLVKRGSRRQQARE